MERCKGGETGDRYQVSGGGRGSENVQRCKGAKVEARGSRCKRQWESAKVGEGLTGVGNWVCWNYDFSNFAFVHLRGSFR